MKKTTSKQATNLLITLSAIVVLASGCTKKREASMPDELAQSVFALSEFGNLEPENATMSIQTTDSLKTLTFGEQAKAVNEKGLVEVDADQVNVNSRLKFMFKKLEIQGLAGKNYKISFAVDREFVTAFKIVEHADELSIIEKALALNSTQVKAQLALQKASDRKQAQTLIAQIKNTQKTAPFLVPIFKFKVGGYGTVQRAKNELKEETSTLTLTKTDWSQATHVIISDNVADRLPISVSASQKEELDQIFVMNRINNKLMSATTLEQELGIPTNLKAEAKLLTRLDSTSIRIYEVSTIEKANLSEAERQALASNHRNNQVEMCSAEIKALLEETLRANCILVNRLSYPISYVVPTLPEINFEGSQSNSLDFKTVLTKNNVGLVKIIKNAVPEVSNNPSLVDPRYTVRVNDIMGKEFFFRRTFEQATSTALFVSGMMGDVQLVKFEMQENRLVIKKTVQVIDFKKDKNSLDQEEVMSFPVRYYQEINEDAAGNALSVPQLQPTTKEKATIIELNWSHNTIPVINSPLAFYANGQCFRSINDQKVTDLDLRLKQDGMLNFSYTYSVTLDPDCAGSFDAYSDYSMTEKSALIQGVKERISFKLNDKSSDVSYVPNVPFTVQNALGYGIFTTGQLKPSENGTYGREGSQIDYPMSHDFRNGKIITYTIGGLPESEGRYLNLQDGQKIDLRETYLEVAKEVIADWNKALHRAFAGTSLDRKGDYITYVINGENGLNAKLGDLDRHFIWFENTINTNYGVLGVSQAGLNPRSGVITADAVIMYAANINYYIELERKNLQLLMQYNQQMDALKKSGIEQLGQAIDQDKSSEAENSVKNKTQFINKLVSHVSLKNNERFTPMNIVANRKLVVRKDNIDKLTQQIKVGFGGKKSVTFDNLETEQAYIHRIVKKALELDISQRNLEDIEQLTAQEILKTFEGSNLISDLEKSALRTKVKYLGMRKRLMAVYNSRPGCLTLAREAMSAQYATMNFREAIKASMKPTLAHEIGHSLGLTHNFIASTDTENFKFADEKDAVRNYSSVMDYMQDSQQKYGGPGPYDVHALRASYTGLVEMQNGKFLNVAQIHKSMNGKWTAFNKSIAKQMSLKKYKYCTDIDVLWEPTCQRHDAGGTASEIVDNIVKDYNDTYVTAYHDYDRLRFGYGAKISAISRAVDSMLRSRQFMDETFYKAITRTGSEAEITDYFMAAMKAYKFMLSVIRTPDASGSFADPSRLTPLPYKYQETVTNADGSVALDEKGQAKTVVKQDIHIVERRALQDIGYDRRRYNTLGIEQNKLVAMQVLTMKGYPHQKYLQASIELSFVDFEKYLMGMNDPSQSLVLMTLMEILSNNLQPAFTNDRVILSPLPADFKAEVTSSMRFYAGVSAILSLEAMTLKDKDNFASLFKVGTAKGSAPKDRLSISQADAADKSTQKLNYFALDNATISNALVREAHRLLTIVKNTEPIQNEMSALLNSMIKGEQSAVTESRNKLAKVLTETNKLGELVSAEDLAANPNLSLDNQVKMVTALFESFYTGADAKNMLRAIIQLQKNLSTNKDAAKDKKVQGLLAEIGRIKNSNAALARELPVLALAQRTLLQVVTMSAEASGQAEELAMADALQIFLSDDDFETRYGLQLNSIDFLSKLTRMTNPELVR